MRRVALVIGNSGYASVPSLQNALNDADDIAAALTRLGFDVTLARDLGAVQMRRQLQAFEDQTIGADIALVYYAGHGIEVDGVNYLIPTDAVLKRDVHVDDEAIPLTRVIAAVEPASKLRLLILDACRNNPFIARMRSVGLVKRSIGRGLAPIEPTGSTLVAYAARDGTTAADGVDGNSPYARALLDSLEEPGLEVGLLLRRVRDQVLKATGGGQEPVTYGALGSDPIYLAPPRPPTVVASLEPTSTPTLERMAEEPKPAGDDLSVAYAAAQRIGTTEAWDAFLEYCRDSVYCGLARAARDSAARDVAALPEAQSDAAAASTPPPAPVPTEAPAATLSPAPAAPPQALANADTLARDGLEPQGEKADDLGLALAYHFGKNGRPIDHAAAKDHYAKAVEGGSMAALTGLGVLHYAANGVPRDHGEAFRLFKQAAEGGHPGAMNNLGALYEKGEGTQRDEALAREWYDRAAQAGNSSAKHALGLLYASGRGAPLDVDRGAELVVEALAGRSPIALAELPADPGRYDQAILKGAQRFLVEQGHLSGTIDGRIGPASRRAFESWSAAANGSVPLEAVLELDAGGRGKHVAPAIANERPSKPVTKQAKTEPAKAGEKAKPKPAAQASRPSKPKAKPQSQATRSTTSKPKAEARRQTMPKPQTEASRPAKPKAQTQASRPAKPKAQTQASRPAKPRAQTQASRPAKPKPAATASAPSRRTASAQAAPAQQPRKKVGVGIFLGGGGGGGGGGIGIGF